MVVEDHYTYTHLAREGVPFCYFCGAGLVDHPKAALGLCVRCANPWQRCYTSACPCCSAGWVPLHPPVEFIPGVAAMGSGWCDCCDSHVIYRWYGGVDTLGGTEPPTFAVYPATGSG